MNKKPSSGKRFGIITVSKRELITPEQKPSLDILEVVVANLSESTTTSKQPQPNLCRRRYKAQSAFFFENYFSR